MRWKNGQQPGLNLLRLLPFGPDRIGKKPVRSRPSAGNICFYPAMRKPGVSQIEVPPKQ
jgi:hypothetical protein